MKKLFFHFFVVKTFWKKTATLNSKKSLSRLIILKFKVLCFWASVYPRCVFIQAEISVNVTANEFFNKLLNKPALVFVHK